MTVRIHTAQVNQFRVESDLALPCDPSGDPVPSSHWAEVSVRYAPGPLDGFSCVYPLAARYGGRLRSYDVGSGILVCLDRQLRLLVGKDGRSVLVDHEQGDSLLGFDA